MKACFCSYCYIAIPTYWHKTSILLCSDRLCASGIHAGHRGVDLSLFLNVWGLTWEDESHLGNLQVFVGVRGWGLKSTGGIFAHVASGWFCLLAEISAWLLAGTSVRDHCFSPHGLAWASSQRGSWIPRVSIPKEPGRSGVAFHYLALEVT